MPTEHITENVVKQATEDANRADNPGSGIDTVDEPKKTQIK